VLNLLAHVIAIIDAFWLGASDGREAPWTKLQNASATVNAINEINEFIKVYTINAVERDDRCRS